MDKTVPKWFEHRLSDMGGRNPYGMPKLRMTWGPSRRIEGGVMKGRYMYPNAENPHQPLECWILETWLPPQLLKADWDEAILGPFPAKGMYGMVDPIAEFHADGTVTAFPLTEATLNSIEKKYAADQEWAAQPEEKRYQDFLDAEERHQKMKQEHSDKQADELFDYVMAHEQDIDNEEKRVWSMPGHLDTTRKGAKMPLMP